MSIVVLLVVATAIGFGLYLAVMYGAIPGAVDERFGSLEELPENLGKWVEDASSEFGKAALAKGRRREVRTLHGSARSPLGRQYLIKQARYRDIETGEILEVEPEQRVPRRRTKVGG